MSEMVLAESSDNLQNINKRLPIEDFRRIWKKITDISGINGWISNSQLSEKDFVIVVALEDLFINFQMQI